MTRLTDAARDFIVQIPAFQQLVATGLVASDAEFPSGWVFSDYPFYQIEDKSYSCLLVITYGGQWTDQNEHNTAEFPQLIIDIWASPTRDATGQAMAFDADTLIERVYDVLKPYFHTVQPSVPQDAEPWQGQPGTTRVWGRAEQISNYTGVIVHNCHKSRGPDFADVREGNKARMGRYVFNVTTS